MPKSNANPQFWQPIATAPRDGSRVLLFREEFAEAQAVGWWSADQDEWIPVNGSVFPGATHWAPLLNPPA